jgi:hypothetical protein
VSEINHGEPWNAVTPHIKPARRPLRGAVVEGPRTNASEKRWDNAPSNSSNEAAEALASDAPRSHLWIVLSYFIIAFSCQLVLLIPVFGHFRVELRIIPFALSMLLAIGALKERSAWLRLHKSVPYAVIVMCIMVFGLLNQETQSLVAGIAQVVLAAAILSPLLWVGRLRIGVGGFTVIVICLWAFNATSAGFGVLQILFPGRFQPATSTVTQDMEDQGISYNIELADGTTTVRPYGLTDQPGGAATAGLTAFVFGLGLLVATKKLFIRALYLAGMGMGLFIMYLSQVRVSLVMSGVAIVAFVVLMALRGEFGRLTGALAALAVVIIFSTSAAFAIGGSQTRDRFFTLVDENPGDVYYANRGHFLDYTFNYVLPEYPVGAGLGRYGMMSHYFDKSSNSGALWAEIQWTAWAYDGGWLMVIAYPLAILVALWVSFTIGRKSIYGPVGLWAAIVTSYNISVIAVTFSYPFFLSQSGLEFWLLNAALFSAAQFYLRGSKSEVPEGFEVLPAPWRPTLASGESAGSVSGPVPRRRPLGRPRLPAVVPIFDPAGPANQKP